MAQRIIWSPDAADDLEQIVKFIRRDSPRYAAGVATEVIEVIEDASVFPRAGRIVPEFDDELLRERRVFNYRIIYRIDQEAIHIAAIIHGARDLRQALGTRTI